MPSRTTPYLTKFEVARLIGVRTLQLSDQNVQTAPGESVQQHAIRELLDGRSTAIIRRYLPNNTFEDVRVADLKIDSHARHFQLNPYA